MRLQSPPTKHWNCNHQYNIFSRINLVWKCIPIISSPKYYWNILWTYGWGWWTLFGRHIMGNWMDAPCTPIDTQPPPPLHHHPGPLSFDVIDLRAVLNHHFDCPWAAFNIVTLRCILFYSDLPSPSIHRFPGSGWASGEFHGAKMCRKRVQVRVIIRN